MSDNAEKNTNVGSGMQTIFDIQVCSADGQLLSQYTLTRQDNNVATLGAAEQRARMNLSDYHGDPLVIIVSMETLTKLRQVQIKVGPNEPRAHPLLPLHCGGGRLQTGYRMSAA